MYNGRVSNEVRRSGAFRAIADPTRRAILDVLAGGESTVGALCRSFAISQSAVSQHLRVLRVAGLVTPRREGRRRYYSLQPGPLREVYDWVGHYEQFWTKKLSALGDFLDRKEGER